MEKDIPGFPGYKANCQGDIYTKGGKKLKPIKHNAGYLKVNIHDENGKVQSCLIHRLILLAFYGNPPKNKPQCRHKDGNKHNNSIENLAWGSAFENAQDKVRHGTNKRSESSRFSKTEIVAIKELRQQGWTLQQIAEKFKTCKSQVHYIVTGKYWEHLN